mmetsp:Transcript_34725/g.79625  ORF Transcript_34725/g.79625 Transcript_34725/m.79625 type:complete len:246 (-) Transcript_34725:28-765(-)
MVLEFRPLIVEIHCVALVKATPMRSTTDIPPNIRQRALGFVWACRRVRNGESTPSKDRKEPPLQWSASTYLKETVHLWLRVSHLSTCVDGKSNLWVVQDCSKELSHMWAKPKAVVLVLPICTTCARWWPPIFAIHAQLAEQASVHIHEDKQALRALLAEVDLIIHSTTALIPKSLHDLLEMLEFLCPGLLLLFGVLVGMNLERFLLHGLLELGLLNVTLDTQLVIEGWHVSGNHKGRGCLLAMLL